MRSVQSPYIAALFKLHEHQIEVARIDPKIEKEYAEIVRLREKLRLALSQRKLRIHP